ncbi:sensor histidine kinase [Streptomyces armeniacus]|uniref:sensor histidine kinase n=1 Tax=Streptomyces armeniacus TaxID=83291 RepID=UPI001FE2867A|nr:nitrate- and nitrite sensing domain-containing protein [Streptomyces armeniacus]
MVAVAFAARALTPATSQAVQADRLTTMVEAAASAGDLAYKLQHERAAAAAVMASQGDAAQLQTASKATDASVNRYRQQRDGLSKLPATTESTLDRIDRSLDELPSLRAQARSGASSLSSMAFGYRIVVADLIAYRDGIAQADGVEANVADHIRAAAALSKATEYVGQQQVTVVRAMDDGGFTPASQRSFDATRLGYTESTAVVSALGPGEWRSWLDQTLAGPKALASQRLEDEVGRSHHGENLEISPTQWQKATSDRLGLLHSVERRADADVLKTVKDQRTTYIWWAVGELCIVLVTLVGALFIAYRLAKVMIRRLRHLRNAANEVAHERLPQVMTALAEPGAVSGATPDEIAERAGKPLESLGQDEIGEVGEAFNAVHYAAVRLAAEQAEAHEKFAETLVGVARRGAQLTSVMTSELSTVQREELDPERMEVLFALDHLAIRMERNANNLLVLGGYGRGRVRTADAPCTSVIYAAAQQIERFGRVSLGHVDPSIGIAARVVDDVAHLLAELLDNATRFSAPDTQVGVAAWHLWDRAVVQIVDEGVGMNDERRAELNAKLAEPQSDVGGVRSMGLQVAARLAARHGIVVEMRASSGPGTIVEVTLPKGALATLPQEEIPAPERRDAPPSAADAAAQAGAAPVGAPPATGAGGTPDADGLVGGRRPAPVPGAGPPLRLRGRGHDDRAGTPNGHGGSRTAAPGSGTDRPAPVDEGSEASEHGSERRPPSWAAQTSAEPRVAGISAAGLPVRKRRTPGEGAGPEGAEQRPAPKAKKAPKRRDSRQVSDVLAAYAQGINRSTGKSGGSSSSSSSPSSPSSSPSGSTGPAEDQTQRRT